jgi:hypothetical protein
MEIGARPFINALGRRRRRGAFLGAVRPAARRGSLLALVAVAFAAPATASGEPSPASGKEPLASVGDCTEVALSMQVPSSRVRPFVPSRFEVKEEAAGVASVVVFGERCRLAAGKDEPSEDSYLFGTFTDVRDRKGAGDGSFDFSWTTTDRAYHNGLRTLGFGELVPGAIFDPSETAGGLGFTGRVPGGAMPFSFEGRTAPAPTLPPANQDFPSTHWSTGSGQRFVRCIYLHDFTRATGAVGTVRADPRSPLAEMIGDEPVQGAGLMGEFHFDGKCRFA